MIFYPNHYNRAIPQKQHHLRYSDKIKPNVMLNITMICIIMITIAPCRLHPDENRNSLKLSSPSIRSRFSFPQKIHNVFGAFPTIFIISADE